MGCLLAEFGMERVLELRCLDVYCGLLIANFGVAHSTMYGCFGVLGVNTGWQDRVFW